MLLTEEQVHMIRLERRGESFWFVYDRHHTLALLVTLMRWANNPDLALTWSDMWKVWRESRNW